MAETANDPARSPDGLRRDLVGAVDRGEIVPFFQPQIDVASGRIVAVEALVRWRHPAFGLLEPEEFVAIAEDSALIDEVGGFMLDDGCRCATAWDEASTPVQISVNVSAVQLAGTEVFARLRACLDRSSLPEGCLTVEITESTPIDDVAAVAAQLRALRQLGLGLSLDDLGMDFADRLLEALPLSEVKVDQSLMQRADAEATGRVTQIVTRARVRELLVVGEGIETATQFARARALGCDRVQGYLFGRPVGEAAMTELLRRDAA